MADPPEDDAKQPEQAKNQPTRLRLVTPEQLKNLTIRELEALSDSECAVISGALAREEKLGPGEAACKEYGDSDGVEGVADDQLSRWSEADDPRFLAVAAAISMVHKLFVSEAEKLSRLPIDPAAHLLALRRLAASIKRNLWQDPPPEIARWHAKPDVGGYRKAVEEHVSPILDRLVRKYHEFFQTDLPEVRPGDATDRRTGPANRSKIAAARATERQAIVNPILKDKGWKTVGKLVTASGVGKATVYGYMDGTRAWISFDNGKAIADALGIDVGRLPDVRPKP